MQNNNHLALIYSKNKALLKDGVIFEKSNFFDNKVSVKNVTLLYTLAKVFNLSRLAETTLSYIQRCFSMVVETQSFLELNFELVAKILSSSEINIHSEVEVYNAAISWLKYKINDRSKYAKQLLLAVRLPLLSDCAVNGVVNSTSSFIQNDEFAHVLKEIIARKDHFFKNKRNVYYKTRYCSQEKFHTLIFCGFEETCCKAANDVDQTKRDNSNSIKFVPTLYKKHYCSESACIKGEVYLLGGTSDHLHGIITSVEKYSPESKTWTEVARMLDDRILYTACAYMDSIFVIGGTLKLDSWITLNSCLQFNTTSKKWKEVSRMTEARERLVSAVFEGRIIVSGGEDGRFRTLNTVEAYDVISDKWSSMPNLVKRTHHHKLVAVKNKLYVVRRGGDDCEVFDTISGKFVVFKQEFDYFDFYQVVSIGNKIMIFYTGISSIIFYDVEENEWFEQPFEATKDLNGFSTVKIPWY